MSFITQFWKSGMESQVRRDAKMRERVAKTAIGSVKISEGEERPYFPQIAALSDNQTSEFPIHGAVHPDVKNGEADAPGTYMTAKYYADEAKKRRDELLAKYNQEVSA